MVPGCCRRIWRKHLRPPRPTRHRGRRAFTRRTARFGELAVEVDRLCLAEGAEVGQDDIDAALNARVALVAHRMRIGARAALVYAPDTVAAVLAAELVEHEAATTTGLVIELDSRR